MLTERYKVKYPSVTVPANVTSLLEVKGTEREIVLLVPGHPLPIRLKGDDAEAWLAFEEGRIECPPNVNGVRDVIGAYAARIEAKATLGQPTRPDAFVGQGGPSYGRAEQPFGGSTFQFSPEEGSKGSSPAPALPSVPNEVVQYQTEQGRGGSIDYDKIRKRLNGEAI